MEYVQFGSTEFKVSRLALGCMSMSGAYGPADDNESIATLHKAFDLGINFLDTSASYGQGHNHELIKKALQGRRERIVIHSKSGSPRTPDATGNRSGSTPAIFNPELRAKRQTAGRRRPRYFLHVAGRSRYSGRRIGGRHGQTGRARPDTLHRPFGSERQLDSARAQGPSDRFFADGIFALVARPRRRQYSGLPRIQHGLHGLFAARAGFFRRCRCTMQKI